MIESKKGILMKSLFWSQLTYCLLVWMFHSRTVNNKINHMHEKCLRIICNHKNLSYKNFFVRDRSASEHYPIFQEVFNNRNLNYELRHPSQSTSPRVINVYNVSESIVCLSSKIWNMVPSELKKISSINTFKNAIEQWCPRNCPCRICKRYLGNIGYI